MPVDCLPGATWRASRVGATLTDETSNRERRTRWRLDAVEVRDVPTTIGRAHRPGGKHLPHCLGLYLPVHRHDPVQPLGGNTAWRIIDDYQPAAGSGGIP